MFLPVLLFFFGIEIWQCFLQIVFDEKRFVQIYREVATANVLMLTMSFVFLWVTHYAYKYICNPKLPSGMSIEEIDLEKVPEDILQRWAKQINEAQGLEHVGAWDGETALKMMRLYSQKPCNIKHTEGVCLRVTRKRKDDICERSHRDSIYDHIL